MPKEPQVQLWPLLVMAAAAGYSVAKCFDQYFYITPGYIDSSNILLTSVSVGLLSVWLWKRRAQSS
jgi:hypothetical protein